jgi:hypothetical protein
VTSARSAEGVRKPPLLLLGLLVASLAMSVLTVGHARDYVKSWNRVRRGKSALEQRLTLGRRQGWPTAVVPWFDRSFLDFAERLKKTVPADARILVEPDPAALQDDSGRARWFMYLNYAAYPLRFYVRKPAYAGGTLVDYGRWLQHHVKARGMRFKLDEQIELDERDIRWKVVFPVTTDFERDGTRLYRLEAGEWRPVALAAHESGEAEDFGEAEAFEDSGVLGPDDEVPE